MDSKRGRILALDILRGYFITVIIINHLAWQTNLFEPFAGKGGLWATAAEGFFAVSGILVGYIYGPKILKATAATFVRIWKRSLLLYGLFIGSTLAFTFLALWINSPNVPPGLWSYGGTATDIIRETASFNYLYGLNDFLSRYALFMAAAPFILWFLAAYGRRAGLVIVAISAVAWLCLQPYVHLSPHADIAIWQVVFVPSIVIGYYLPSIEQWFGKLSKIKKRVFLGILFSVTVVTYLLSYIYTSYNSGGLIFWLFDKLKVITDPIIIAVRFVGDNIGHLADKQSLGILAIATGIFWFWSLYIITRKYEGKINAATRGVLSFTGKNSLTAYIIHAFVIFFLTLVVQNPPDGNVFIKTVVTTVVVALSLGLTWLFVSWHRLFK